MRFYTICDPNGLGYVLNIDDVSYMRREANGLLIIKMRSSGEVLHVQVGESDGDVLHAIRAHFNGEGVDICAKPSSNTAESEQVYN